MLGLTASSAVASVTSQSTSSTKPANPTHASSGTSPHSPSASSPKHTSSGLATAVGCGVGVPLGVLTIAIITFLVWRERRKTKLVPQEGLPPENQGDKEGVIARITHQTLQGSPGWNSTNGVDSNGLMAFPAGIITSFLISLTHRSLLHRSHGSSNTSHSAGLILELASTKAAFCPWAY